MRKTGTVKWFDTKRGFGFILPDGGGRDVFVHHTEIEKSTRGYKQLIEGEPVSFEQLDGGERGPKALNVARGR